MIGDNTKDVKNIVIKRKYKKYSIFVKNVDFSKNYESNMIFYLNFVLKLNKVLSIYVKFGILPSEIKYGRDNFSQNTKVEIELNKMILLSVP